MHDHYTLKELEEMYGRKPSSLRRSILRGLLNAEKRSGTWFVLKSDAITFFENPPKPGPKPQADTGEGATDCDTLSPDESKRDNDPDK